MHGLNSHLDLPYRRRLAVPHEMPWIGQILGLNVIQLPDVPTTCARMQDFKLPRWRELRRLSAGPRDTGEHQAIDALRASTTQNGQTTRPERSKRPR